MNYEECCQEIASFEGRGVHRGLERMVEALRLLGNPHRQFASAHVAGTNGKGSTCAFLSQILMEAGYRAGFTLSPHLEDFRERIQINRQWISPSDLVALHLHLKNKLGDLKPTYFEWATLMALVYFAESRVDVAVLETGMGGRWDATNIALPLVGAVTNVGLDHQSYLGSTPEEILVEKMQILKPGMTAWTGIREEKLLSLLKDHCRERGIPLHSLNDNFQSHADGTFSMPGFDGLRPSLQGRHQHANAALAVGMASTLAQKGFHIDEHAVRNGLQATAWPGRLEVLSQKPFILADVAHNPDGIGALAEFLRAEGKKFHLVFMTLKDRPFLKMLEVLEPFTLSQTWAYFEDARGFSLEELRQSALRYSLGKGFGVQVLELGPFTWNQFQESVPPDEAILVTGSLYLVSRVRPLVLQR